MVESRREAFHRRIDLPAPPGGRRPRWNRAVITAIAAAAAIATIAAPAAARADEAAAIEAITKLNKRALDEYDNLNFDQAKKTLNEALELCAKSGLADHPITARTHIHLGVVTLGGGTTGREEAIKQFQKALAIEPEIKLTSQVANPEVQAAFDEAVKTAPPPPTPPEGDSSAPPDATPAPATEGLSHDVVSSGVKGKAIAISVTTDPALAAAKVVLVFRPQGVSDFMQVELKEYSPGNWSGSIPESATTGAWVAYALSVANEAGEVVGTQGSPEAPMVVRLSAQASVLPERHPDEEPEPEAESGEGPTWFFGLGLGTGFGWASGNGDVHVLDKVSSGFGASKLGHLSPEVGYFLSPDLLLSVQLRLQFVSGATAMRDPMGDAGTICGSDHVCDPATAAQAVLARATWLFGEGAVRPYVSAILGAGQIRHMATIPGANMCGRDPAVPVKCVDTVTAGPIFAGGAAGVTLNASSNFGVTLGVTPLLGFPNFTFHLDFNGGVVIQI